ncbi:hypothetical protein HRI_002250000 [Hibiscus trionum]|uniref:Reverse transcriptase domain-containing protein n=1 Tax=Hibiscus trionum TaxID=183268 RepID=A0A9W7HYM1_HIBTR|nr:hypothetical protein HRI_002250000 [Hibiscus trionum]
MRPTKANLRWMAIKVDLENAFDRICWDFIENTLIDANDHILYACTDIHNARLIDKVLSDFGLHLGHQASKPKTHLYFSPNTHADLRDDNSETLCFIIVDTLGKYLGVHVIHQRVRCSDFNFILDKMRSRLSGWVA